MVLKIKKKHTNDKCMCSVLESKSGSVKWSVHVNNLLSVLFFFFLISILIAIE